MKLLEDQSLFETQLPTFWRSAQQGSIMSLYVSNIQHLFNMKA
jgi:hypothetical protein